MIRTSNQALSLDYEVIQTARPHGYSDYKVTARAPWSLSVSRFKGLSNWISQLKNMIEGNQTHLEYGIGNKSVKLFFIEGKLAGRIDSTDSQINTRFETEHAFVVFSQWSTPQEALKQLTLISEDYARQDTKAEFFEGFVL